MLRKTLLTCVVTLGFLAAGSTARAQGYYQYRQPSVGGYPSSGPTWANNQTNQANIGVGIKNSQTSIGGYPSGGPIWANNQTNQVNIGVGFKNSNTTIGGYPSGGPNWGNSQWNRPNLGGVQPNRINYRRQP